jgi:hypothetical protein
MSTFHVKVRKKDSKRWAFLSSGGGMNYLRIHAIEFSEESRALEAVNDIVTGNPEYEAKIQAVQP